jgi:hypothetical protein
MALHQIPAYHIDDGEVLMFPVDAAHAYGAHPFEWKKTPWTDDEANEARKKAKEKADAEQRAKSSPKGRVSSSKEPTVVGSKEEGEQSPP